MKAHIHILIFPWGKWELFRYFPIPIFHASPGPASSVFFLSDAYQHQISMTVYSQQLALTRSVDQFFPNRIFDEANSRTSFIKQNVHTDVTILPKIFTGKLAFTLHICSSFWNCIRCITQRKLKTYRSAAVTVEQETQRIPQTWYPIMLRLDMGISPG